MKNKLEGIFFCCCFMAIGSFLSFYYISHDIQQLHTDLVNINASIQLIGK